MCSFPTAYLFKEVSPELIAEKRKRKRCISWGCKRRAGKRKAGRCETCASRLFRLRNDDRYAYHNLKRSAKKRGIEFELSFEDFMEFCCITGYLEMRGKEPHSLSIDRIKNWLPYTMGNIRILTYADNVSHKYEEARDACLQRRRHRVA
jgi:hypothetical protein